MNPDINNSLVKGFNITNVHLRCIEFTKDKLVTTCIFYIVFI